MPHRKLAGDGWGMVLEAYGGANPDLSAGETTRLSRPRTRDFTFETNAADLQHQSRDVGGPRLSVGPPGQAIACFHRPIAHVARRRHRSGE